MVPLPILSRHSEIDEKALYSLMAESEIKDAEAAGDEEHSGKISFPRDYL
jgi:hypothetical protein